MCVCVCFGEEGEGSNTMRNTCLRNVLRRVGQQSNANLQPFQAGQRVENTLGEGSQVVTV